MTTFAIEARRPVREVLERLGSEPPPAGPAGEPAAPRSAPLVEILVARGALSRRAADDVAAAHHHEPERRLVDLLVEVGGVSDVALAHALAYKFHLPFVDLGACAIDEEIVRGVPVPPTLGSRALPLDVDDATVTVALADPADASQLDAMSLEGHRRVKIVVAAASQIRAARRPSVLPARETEDVDAIVGALLAGISARTATSTEREDLDVDGSESGVIRLVNRMLLDAHAAGASDIHIEPNRPHGSTRIRFRVDGECSVYRELPGILAAPLVARVKILADLDISEHRRPQDGKIRFRTEHEVVELRVAALPTVGGNEDIVLRILPPSRPRPVDAIGLLPRDLRELKRLATAPYGLVLCVGPTGSGKTTTLHSILGDLNSPDVKIWTAEDPVEITQPGLRQVQINHKIGLDFAAAMRSFLRADPDIIMVGEMRDLETAMTAITASLTGHLVLSTLHTNNAPETIVRLLDMGLDPFGFSDSLLGVLAQRLARVLCRACKAPARATEEEAATLVTAYGGAERLEADFGVRARDGLRVFRAPGCESCKGSGYRGRAAFVELLVVDDAIRHAIAARADAETIRRLAVAGGMRTLLQNGIAKVLDGTTDMRQVLAVCAR